MSQTHDSASLKQCGAPWFGEQENNSTVFDFRKINAEAALGARESPRNAMGRATSMKIGDGAHELPRCEAEPPSIVSP
jgi:hypothetical protein